MSSNGSFYRKETNIPIETDKTRTDRLSALAIHRNKRNDDELDNPSLKYPSTSGSVKSDTTQDTKSKIKKEE
jgi:hypothetical protein